jgi:hypothetical protein
LDSTGPSVSGRKGNPDFQARLARWRALSPEEQQRLKERYEAWEKLSDSEKKAIRDRMEAWNKLTPEARQQYMERLSQYRRMSPEDRERLKRHWEAWRAMTSEQRRLARRVAEVLKDLPKDQLQSLKAMPLDERRAALRKILADKGIDVTPLPPAAGQGEGQSWGQNRPWNGSDQGPQMRRRSGVESSDGMFMRPDSSASRDGLRGFFGRGDSGQPRRRRIESSDANPAPPASSPAGSDAERPQ